MICDSTYTILELENGTCLMRIDLSLNSGFDHISNLAEALF